MKNKLKKQFSFMVAFNLKNFVPYLFFALLSTTPQSFGQPNSVIIECDFSNAGNTDKKSFSAESISFDSNKLIIVENKYQAAIAFNFDSEESPYHEFNCRISPRQEQSLEAYCKDSSKDYNSIVWNFQEPLPSPGYFRSFGFSMRSERRVVGAGPQWTVFEISKTKAGRSTSIRLRNQMTGFENQQSGFFGNYSGVNGLQSLNLMQSCEIFKPGAYTGAN